MPGQHRRRGDRVGFCPGPRAGRSIRLVYSIGMQHHTSHHIDPETEEDIELLRDPMHMGME